MLESGAPLLLAAPLPVASDWHKAGVAETARTAHTTVTRTNRNPPFSNAAIIRPQPLRKADPLIRSNPLKRVALAKVLKPLSFANHQRQGSSKKRALL